MVYLITDRMDKMILERRVQQMKEVETLLSLVESHFGVSLAAETMIEEKLKKWGEKTKEESSTSPEIEEILGETQSKLKTYEEKKPHMPDYHIGPALEREPQFPGR